MSGWVWERWEGYVTKGGVLEAHVPLSKVKKWNFTFQVVCFGALKWY